MTTLTTAEAATTTTITAAAGTTTTATTAVSATKMTAHTPLLVLLGRDFLRLEASFVCFVIMYFFVFVFFFRFFIPSSGSLSVTAEAI